MDGGSDQWPAIDGTSNHGWDRPKPLTGPPMSGSQNVVLVVGCYHKYAPYSATLYTYLEIPLLWLSQLDPI